MRMAESFALDFDGNIKRTTLQHLIRGSHFMTTTEQSVIVEITDNGKLKRHVYPIVNGDGELMTHRLRRLLAGKIGHKQGDYYGERHKVHFVGLVWRPPYQLLQDILQDRIRLQHELVMLEGDSELARMPPTVIPDKETDTKVTTLVLRELKNRTAIKARIRELDRIKEAQATEGDVASGGFSGSVSDDASSGGGLAEGGGWIQP